MLFRSYFIMLVMNHSAVVFDFLDAREPLQTRYLPFHRQNVPYPLPTTSGSFTSTLPELVRVYCAGNKILFW